MAAGDDKVVRVWQLPGMMLRCQWYAKSVQHWRRCDLPQVLIPTCNLVLCSCSLYQLMLSCPPLLQLHLKKL